MDDAALVLAARSGERSALAALYDRYADRLHDFCFSILRDRDDAADALHDAFLLASQRLDQLRDPARLRPWLYAIARNEAYRRARGRSRVSPTDEVGDVTDTRADPERSAREAELREVVWAAAEGLARRDRVLLDLHVRQGLEGEELALAAGVSPSNIYVLVSRLRQQVERSLGALLVARLGRRDCEELASILEGWDGRFSPLVRKRVARHVDGCDRCGERRRGLVSPLALLAAVPPVAAPAALRDRVLGDVDLASHRGSHEARATRFDRDGFPRPVGARESRRPAATAVIAALVLLGLLAAALVPRGSRDTEVVAATKSTATTAPVGVPTTVAAAIPPLPIGSGPKTTTTTNAPPPGGSSLGPAPSAGPTLDAPSPPATPDTTVPAGPPATTPDPTPETPTPDTDGPVIADLAANPGEIAEEGAGYTCSPPPTSTVSAVVTDRSGVDSVVLSWSIAGGPGEAAMTASGDTWSAVLGPFGPRTVTADTRMILTVTATDALGNASEEQTIVTLYNCTASGP